MTNLTSVKCRPCELDAPTLKQTEIQNYLEQVPDWKIVNNHHLEREFKFKNFSEALAFVNKVGAIAESEGHHPDISFSWGYVRISLFTHAINGLSDNDFILAAKIDTLKK